MVEYLLLKKIGWDSVKLNYYGGGGLQISFIEEVFGS